MPRTLPENWTEPEILWSQADETRSLRHSHERVRGKFVTVVRVDLAKRVARWQSRHVLQREAWTCPYCQWHSTYRGRIRRGTLQQQFTQLVNTWKQDTAHLSNITTRAMHPAYQRIIGMGREAIPFILEEFRRGKLDDWFWALYAITGENPITEDIAGDVERMAEAWLQWGRETGYLSDSSQYMRLSSRT